jgi:hypothetical protein
MLPPADLSAQTLKAVIASDKGNQEIALESKNFQAGKAYALAGEMEAAKGSFEDGVVTLVEAGTMKQLLGSDCLNVASLKVVGPINGDDVRCLRQMLGASEFGESERGKLTTLDLSEASIVKGGDYYYSSDGTYVKKYYTSNNVLGYRIFYMCNNLLTIILPHNITLIDGSAFSSCSSLISINIPDCVTTIGEFAFSSCSSLTCIDIPNSVTSISENVFRNCSSLTSVKISKNITSIGGFAFFGCSSLINIDIPDSVTSIGEYAFADCSFLTSVILQDGVTSIGKYTFANCSSLTSIKIPDSVTSIGYCAFSGCASLTSIDLPDNITSIGNSTFYHCYSLTSIDIPASVTSIGSLAFSSCPLTSVYITDISAWCKITFDGSSSNPLGDGAKLYLNNAELTELIIPEDIKKINDYAFYNCKSLTKVTVGDEVMTIGIAAFRGCSALTMVNIPANVTFIGKEAFHSCKSLVQVYSYAVTPPIINTTDSYSSFDATGSKTLHVLTDCSSKYNASDWGSYFKNIVEMD